MDHASIKQDITGIFEEVMDLEDVTLEDDTTANDIEDWDSLSHVRLVIAVERHFGIKFTNAEIEGLKKFGDLVALVQRKKAA
jgi:acyl carrier protein